MSPKVVISVVNVVAAVLGSLAATNTFPAMTGILGIVAGMLAGIANVNKPGTAAKIEAARQEEPSKP
jgi:hypothetical protein